jgi:hypothetical protein
MSTFSTNNEEIANNALNQNWSTEMKTATKIETNQTNSKKKIFENYDGEIDDDESLQSDDETIDERLVQFLIQKYL